MNQIPDKLRIEILSDPYYKKCSRREIFRDHKCCGKITWEHTLIYKGKQIQEKWAIIPLCEFAHGLGLYLDTGILDKEKNLYIALIRATFEDLKKYPNREWMRDLNYLRKKYELQSFKKDKSKIL